MNFSFVIPGVLAGCARPRAYGGSHDLERLVENGIVGLVSLTETPVDEAEVRRLGMEYLHIPIADFSAPPMSDVRLFVEFVRRVSASKGGPVTVHCGSGYGRTGTMLACYLVSEGRTAEDAIAEVRRLRPGSIETGGQEAAIAEWQRTLAEDA